MKYLLICIAFLPVFLANGQCCHLPSFSVEELPLTKPKSGHGNSHLDVSTKSDSAQFYVDQGLNMFHSYSFHEAYMAFYRATIFDTSCVVCATLEMMSLEKLGVLDKTFLTSRDRAHVLYNRSESEMSTFEKELTRAEVLFYFVKSKYQDTLVSNSYKRLYNLNKGSDQAASFYIRYLDDGYDGTGLPIGNTGMAETIANKAIKQFPNSTSVIHYYTHLFETTKPEKTVLYAAKLPELAPKSGHLVHMPGHAYFHTGQFDKAADAFVSSYKVDSIYNESYKYAKSYNWNIIHNLHFLCVTLVEAGRFEEALKWQEKLEKAAVFLQDQTFTGTYVTVLSKIQIPWRLKKWKKCIEDIQYANAEMVQESWTARYYFDAMEEFFLGRQSFHLDKEDSLSVHIKNFDKIVKSDKKYAKEAGESVLEVQGYKEALTFYGSILRFCNDYISEYSETFDADFKALVDAYESIQSFDPPGFPGSLHEIAADILTNHRMYEEAAVYLAEGAARYPKSATIQLKLARMYVRAGNKEQAQRHLDKFQELWINADTNLLEFEKARMVQVKIDRKD